jgi:hypothetical protein
VVRAIDQNGNEDGNTAEVSATTGAAASFSAQIQPIFSASCTSAGCHRRPGMVAADLDLGAGNAHAALVGVSSTQCDPTRLLVDPGDPDASYLIDKILGVDLGFGTRMPKMGSLTPAEIQLITDWVAEGAADN